MYLFLRTILYNRTWYFGCGGKMQTLTWRVRERVSVSVTFPAKLRDVNKGREQVLKQGHLGKSWLHYKVSLQCLPTLPTQHGHGHAALSLVPPFYDCSVTIYQQRDSTEEVPNNSVNTNVNASDPCKQRQHKSQKGRVLMSGPILPSRFCMAGMLLVRRELCWWSRRRGGCSILSLALPCLSLTAFLKFDGSCLPLITPNWKKMRMYIYISINIEECKGSVQFYCTLGRRWKPWGEHCHSGFFVGLAGIPLKALSPF